MMEFGGNPKGVSKFSFCVEIKFTNSLNKKRKKDASNKRSTFEFDRNPKGISKFSFCVEIKFTIKKERCLE